MADGSINLRRLDSNHTMTIKVNVTKEFRLRMAIAKGLLILASKVIGCSYKIEEGQTMETSLKNTPLYLKDKYGYPIEFQKGKGRLIRIICQNIRKITG